MNDESTVKEDEYGLEAEFIEEIFTESVAEESKSMLMGGDSSHLPSAKSVSYSVMEGV